MCFVVGSLEPGSPPLVMRSIDSSGKADLPSPDLGSCTAWQARRNIRLFFFFELLKAFGGDFTWRQVILKDDY